METKQKTIRFMAVLLVFVGLMVLPITAGAGNLEPSAPPASTMKTLDEVEPRIPIPASAAPAGTFTISQSGSYYLTGDRKASGTAITVNVNDVTIDLAGHSLTGDPSSAGTYGIYMNGRSNVEICNGTIRDFNESGICENSSNSGKQHRVINVRAMSTAYHGIYLMGYGHLVKDCTAAENSGFGIYAGKGCTVTGNTCYDNGADGIDPGYGCTVTGNTVYDNGGTGIDAGQGCTVTGNTVYDNNYCGIWTYDGCTVTGNTVRNNNQDETANYGGIRVFYDCLVKGNTATDNKQNNIYVYGDDNCIEENLVTDSGNGICFEVTGNYYTNNRASGNTYDYNDVPGNTGVGNVSF